MFDKNNNPEPYSEEWCNQIKILEGDIEFDTSIYSVKYPILNRSHIDGPYVSYNGTIRWLNRWERLLLWFNILPREFKHK